MATKGSVEEIESVQVDGMVSSGVEDIITCSVKQ